MWQVQFGTGLASEAARRSVGLVSVVLAAGLAGCSADVVRLDSPASFGFNDGPSRPSASMSRMGAANASPDSYGVDATSSYSPPAPNPKDQVRVAALPDPPAATPAPSYSAPAPSRPVAAPPAASIPAASAAAETGDAIQVAQGDTLYGLSRKHHVAVSELMSVNHLTSPNLKPGQTLYLPSGRSAGRKPLARPAEVAAAPPQKPAVPASAPLSADVSAKYDGSYTVKKGDNLYGLALQFHVPPAELQQVNGITDVRKVRPGTVLKVPAGAASGLAAGDAPAVPSVAATTTVPAVPVPPAAVAEASPPAASSGPKSVLLNGDKKVAAVEVPASSDAQPGLGTGSDQAAPQASAGGDAGAGLGKLRWPVKGKIIATFGSRPDGTHNDGVNLSVPLGTEVHAAEGGVVAYAGSELKGYGNLILIRHDNGWITAYAHNEEILAKRGDKVKRGQIIAKAGKSGQVDQPQVHFELRQGSKPVDPSPFMEKI